jgi:hypothetical protein
MEMKHGHAAWACIIFMQHENPLASTMDILGHATSSTDMQLVYAARTCSVNMQLEHTALISSMDIQQGHAAWT